MRSRRFRPLCVLPRGVSAERGTPLSKAQPWIIPTQVTLQLLAPRGNQSTEPAVVVDVQVEFFGVEPIKGIECLDESGLVEAGVLSAGSDDVARPPDAGIGYAYAMSRLGFHTPVDRASWHSGNALLDGLDAYGTLAILVVAISTS